MDDWDFDTAGFELASRDVDDDEVNDNSLSEWFDQREEEPCNPLGVFSHEQIMAGLANAVKEWKKVTQQRCQQPRPGLFFGAFTFDQIFDYIDKTNKPLNHIPGQRQKVKKRAATIPISPNLATKKRLGKTKREENGEKLRKERFKQNMMVTVTKPRYKIY